MNEVPQNFTHKNVSRVSHLDDVLLELHQVGGGGRRRQRLLRDLLVLVAQPAKHTEPGWNTESPDVCSSNRTRLNRGALQSSQQTDNLPLVRSHRRTNFHLRFRSVNSHEIIGNYPSNWVQNATAVHCFSSCRVWADSRLVGVLVVLGHAREQAVAQRVGAF